MLYWHGGPVGSRTRRTVLQGPSDSRITSPMKLYAALWRTEHFSRSKIARKPSNAPVARSRSGFAIWPNLCQNDAITKHAPVQNLDDPLGVEPRSAGSKPAILPLDEGSLESCLLLLLRSAVAVLIVRSLNARNKLVNHLRASAAANSRSISASLVPGYSLRNISEVFHDTRVALNCQAPGFLVVKASRFSHAALSDVYWYPTSGLNAARMLCKSFPDPSPSGIEFGGRIVESNAKPFRGVPSVFKTVPSPARLIFRIFGSGFWSRTRLYAR